MISHIKIMLKDNSNCELTIYRLFYDNTLCMRGEKWLCYGALHSCKRPLLVYDYKMPYHKDSSDKLTL